jgi:hypothetical protein
MTVLAQYNAAKFIIIQNRYNLKTCYVLRGNRGENNGRCGAVEKPQTVILSASEEPLND